MPRIYNKNPATKQWERSDGILIQTGGGSGGDVSKVYVDQQDRATLNSAKAYADGKLVTIDIETRGENNFWTDPLTTSQQIVDMVNAGKEVRLHFYDTVTNTGDQLYTYETTDAGVPIFRRNIITANKASRINIKVQYNGEVKFEEVNYSSASTPATETELGGVKAKHATARQVTPIGIGEDDMLYCDTGLMSISDSGAVISSDCVSDYEHQVECKISGVPELAKVKVTRCGANILPDSLNTTSGKYKGILRKSEGGKGAFLLHAGVKYVLQTDVMADGLYFAMFADDSAPFLAATYNKNKLEYTPANDVLVAAFAYINSGIDDAKIWLSCFAEKPYSLYAGNIYTPETDGTVKGMTSFSPDMTIMSDAVGVYINAAYLADSTLYYKGKFEAVNAELQNAVTYEALDDALSKGVNSI